MKSNFVGLSPGFAACYNGRIFYILEASMPRSKPDALSLLTDLYSLSALRPLLSLPGIKALGECLEAAVSRDALRAIDRYHAMFAAMCAAPRLSGEVLRDYWLYGAMTSAKLFLPQDDIAVGALERDLAVVQLFCSLGGKGVWDILQKQAASAAPDPVARMSSVAWSGASAERSARPGAPSAPAELTPPIWQYASRAASLELCAGDDMLTLIDAFERESDWPRLAHSLAGLYAAHGDIALFSHKRMACVSGALIPMTSGLSASWEEFVGLDAAKEELARRADGFIAGERTENLFIHGEPGLGKTSLVLAMADALPARLIAARAGEFAALRPLLLEAARQPMRFIVLVDDVQALPEALLSYAAFEQSENVWLVATGRAPVDFPARLMLEPPPLKAFIQRVMELARGKGAELDYDQVQDACIDWKVDGGELTASAALKVLGKLI